MYRNLSDFMDDWQYESSATLKIFNNLTDQSLTQKVSDEGRSLGRVAWHITQMVYDMISKTGLVQKDSSGESEKINGFEKDSPVPNSAKEISDKYNFISSKLLEKLKKKWTDRSLDEEVNMYGEKWKKGMALTSLIKHQSHHRGQMTVLMRQAGLKVPGVYGPSKEEWAAMNLQPME
jgi:uncharacterized damage-inducible protein DinB